MVKGMVCKTMIERFDSVRLLLQEKMLSGIFFCFPDTPGQSRYLLNIYSRLSRTGGFFCVSDGSPFSCRTDGNGAEAALRQVVPEPVEGLRNQGGRSGATCGVTPCFTL